MKKLLSLVLAISLLCTAGAAFAEGPGGGRGGNGGRQGGARGGNGGGTDKSGDAELQAMIAETAPKFQLLTFFDAETGTSLQYQLYIPEHYDETQSYPMIQFIPDSSVVGKGADAVLTQGWGGLIWATDAEQAKHPAFVVVPVMVASEAAKGARAGDIVRSMVTNPFLIAVAAGVLLNVTGLYGAIVASDFGPAITSTLSMATSPIVALILFILGYDLTVEKDTIVPIIKLSVVRIAWFALIILGFFLLFGQRMADRDFMIAVIIYFACPTGFAMSTLIQPLYKGDREPGFVSAFTSLYVVVTLVVYTLVVLFLA